MDANPHEVEAALRQLAALDDDAARAPLAASHVVVEPLEAPGPAGALHEAAQARHHGRRARIDQLRVETGGRDGGALREAVQAQYRGRRARIGQLRAEPGGRGSGALRTGRHLIASPVIDEGVLHSDQIHGLALQQLAAARVVGAHGLLDAAQRRLELVQERLREAELDLRGEAHELRADRVALGILHEQGGVHQRRRRVQPCLHLVQSLLHGSRVGGTATVRGWSTGPELGLKPKWWRT
eukprot:817692-Alexandrium_andersonii.AAC.2